MQRRRIFLLALLVLVAAGVLDLAGLFFTSAKVLGYPRAFNWWSGPISHSSTSIGKIRSDIYVSPRSRSEVVLVHGVGETGKESTELKSVAEAFAASGFRVVVPDFERMKKQNVTPEDIDDAALVLKSLGRDAGIVCVSYGCGPALIAASRAELRDRIRFIVLYGSYFDLTNTLRFVVTTPPTPLGYSKWLYMAANADLIDDTMSRDRLLAIASERRQKPRELWKLPAEELTGDARLLLDLFESNDAPEFDARLMHMPRLRDRLERLSPARYFSGVRARLLILHINSDPCIPSTESVQMAQSAKQLGIPHSLTLLNMHGHSIPVWPEFGARTLFSFYVPESLRFIWVLHRILSYA